MNDVMLRAAVARAGGVGTRADRPRQRRCGVEDAAPARVNTPATMDLRASGDTGPLLFNGYGSVYERAYEMWDFFGPYTEIVESGAGAESLARDDLDVPLLIQHAGMPLARTTNGTLRLTEDQVGLSVEADLDPADRDVEYVAPKIRAKLVTEMSFAFRITLGQWSPDYSEYRIIKYDIHRGDVAIVRYGANPWTGEDGLMGIREQVRAVLRGADVVAVDDVDTMRFSGFLNH